MYVHYKPYDATYRTKRNVMYLNVTCVYILYLSYVINFIYIFKAKLNIKVYVTYIRYFILLFTIFFVFV